MHRPGGYIIVVTAVCIQMFLRSFEWHITNIVYWTVAQFHNLAHVFLCLLTVIKSVLQQESNRVETLQQITAASFPLPTMNSD